MTQLDIAFLERFTETIGPIGKSLGMLIRPTFIAAPGKTLVWGDWSAIEARVLPWLAASPGAEQQLAIFRASDADKTRPDVYVFNAAQLLGVDPQVMWDAFLEGEKWAKDGRQSHGKVPVLSLGFGGAVGALMKMAINYKVYLDEATAQKMVEGWRAANQWAPDFWGKFHVDRHGNVERSSGLWGAVNMALRNPGTAYAAGRVAYVFDESYMGGTLFCALPCGRLITYPDCRLRTRQVKDKDTGDVSEKTAIWYRKGYGWSALWHGKCLAGDTLVLTARGWVPIVAVQPWDLLWDGEAWVAHEGLQFQGNKVTMPVDGVWMTPDHEVLTDDGWRQASQLEGHDRASVRLPDGIETRPFAGARAQFGLVGAVRLRLAGEAGVERGLDEGGQTALADVVRVSASRARPADQPHARDDEAPGLLGLALDDRPLSVADQPGMEELRRARHYGVRPVVFVRELLDGHGADLSARAIAGARGQREGLQPGELRLGDTSSSSTQPANEHADSHAVGADHGQRGERAQRHKRYDAALSVGAQLPAGAAVRRSEFPEPVYDLMNAGPRQRFTVLGETGAVIVHNCAENITQAVAGSILRETLKQLDLEFTEFDIVRELWALDGEADGPVGHTHDEGVLEVRDEPKVVALAREVLDEIMGRWRPEWRATLPLTAEVTEWNYYTKALG